MRLRSLSALGVVSFLVAGMLADSGATARAATPSCLTSDVRTHVTATNLQSAIDAASSGDTIQVQGVCGGNFVVDKDLRLVGKATADVPEATLDGLNSGTVILVPYTGLHLAVKDLVITNGTGGGIGISGPLTLLGTTRVTGNTAEAFGGGIRAAGYVALRDSVQVDHNSAGSGGGIFSYGAVSISGDAAVIGNTATAGDGGGIKAGAVTLTDDARVKGNVATGSPSEGGGLWASRLATLAGSARVRGNEADFGGGVFAHRFLTLKDQASVMRNSATKFRGGIWGRYVSACNASGVDGWTGTISPNLPDDPPPVTTITC